jgi:hypothetical protein
MSTPVYYNYTTKHALVFNLLISVIPLRMNDRQVRV